ncbi:MAG: VRR-NUC domain-containing protein [bacterium]|nr:VRR-NUC domain-containing protein [Candidatus Aquidulcis frankliniae]
MRFKATSQTPSKRGQPEHRMQVALFKWAKLAAATDPRIGLMFAIPNGGARNAIVASKLKAEGVKPGVPDVFLPVPAGEYHGLWIELKVKPNKPSPEQQDWIRKLILAGYRVEVVYDDWDRARRLVEAYLRGEGPF